MLPAGILRPRILVVDDTPSNLGVMVSVLEKDYELSIAESGRQALALLAALEKPDLILLDMMMPDMDGYQVCAVLKADVATRGIPVIFVTARTDFESETRALAAGAVDFIHKPINAAVVRARVALHLELQRQKVELELNNSRARAFMNTALDAVVVIDADSRIVEFNQAGERLFGFSAQEIIGAPVETLMPAEIRAHHRGYLASSTARSIAVQMAATRTLMGQAKDGRQFPIEVSVGGLGDAGGRMFVGIFRDISERQRAEQELEQSRAREAELAASIQARLLLRAPPKNLSGFSVNCVMTPALAVGGDFYTFTRIDSWCFEILIADVMGKGISAALTGAGVKSSYHRAWSELLADMQSTPSPASIVNAMHASITPELQSLESFVTLSLLRFDRRSRVMTWVNAGHPPALVARIDCPGEELLADNVPLGVLDSENYVEHTMPLGTGDTFVLYSDGVTESTSEQGEEYGTARLKSALALAVRSRASPSEILESMHDDVRSHTGPGPIRDDQTFIVVTVGPLEPDAS